MAKHSKHRSPPCDCLNKVADLGSGRQSGSCTQCDDQYLNGLCAYVAHFECNYYTQNATREKVAEPCLVLRKDCILGCTYSSRWACTSNNPTNDAPVLRWDNCDALGALAQRCAGCERIGCITGTISTVTADTICANEAGAGPFTFTNLDFVLSYTGGQVPTECQLNNTCGPGDDLVYADSCVWSGYAVDADGNTQYQFPIFMDYFEGGWRMRFYYRVGVVVGFELCLPPVDDLDLRTNFQRVNIDLPYFTCDPSTWTAVSHDDDSYFNLEIASWSVTSGCPTPAVIDMSDCTWAQAGCEGADTCDQSEEPTGSTDEFYDSIDQCYTKWRMTITSPTTATLELTTREGFFAIYTCENFNCYARSTFKMAAGAYDEYTNPTGVYSPEVIGLPLCLCVSPLSYAAGGCVNSGLEACCDSGGPSLPVHLTINNCDDVQVIDDWVPFYRGIALPCGVTDQTGDECLYFGAYVNVDAGCADWGGDLFIYMACGSFIGGSDQQYNYVVYCLNNDTLCWEEMAAYTQDYECQCNGPNPASLTITKPCCCPTITCGTCEIPTTITVTLSTTYCSYVDGVSIDLVWDGSTYWIGEIVVGDYRFRVRANCAAAEDGTPFLEGELCVYVESDYPNDPCLPCDNTFTTTTAQCGPFEATATITSPAQSARSECEPCTSWGGQTVTLTFTE